MPAGPSETESLIEHEIRVGASPEIVFAYFTDPAKMVRWMGTEATLDPRPGGVCRIHPSGQLVMLGEFLEVDPPHRLVFIWGWEMEMFSTPRQSTLVEVSLTPDGEGTIVQLAHRAPATRRRCLPSRGLGALPAETRPRRLQRRRGHRSMAGRGGRDLGPAGGGCSPGLKTSVLRV
jgi:uncharacterized protein YndB with AHSA1/START domain